MSLKAWTAVHKGILYGYKDGVICPKALNDLVQDWDGREYRTTYGDTLEVNAAAPRPETVYVLCEELIWKGDSLEQIKIWDYSPEPIIPGLVY